MLDWEKAESEDQMVRLLMILFGFGFFVYIMPIVLVYVSILINIVSSLAYACRHGIALNMLTAGAALCSQPWRRVCVVLVEKSGRAIQHGTSV